jgi:hypothetical protein
MMVDLEERSIEPLPATCQECGATLTDAELQAFVEGDGPPLCTIHAAEVVPVPEPDEADEAGSGFDAA